MKKLKWNRALTILVLMMFITVTYASFNTNLFIDGKAYVRVDKDIRITNIRLLETEYDGYENVDSEYTNHSVSTDVSLPRQGSSLTYEVTISNVSDKRYKITDILEEAYDNKDVKYEILNASIGNIVEPHTEKTFQIKFTNNTTVVEEDDVYETKTYTFDYTGDVQEFVVPYDGDYKIELWGAQGGSGSKNSIDYPGGYGGYTSGIIHLNKNKTLKVYVGEMGSTINSKGLTSHAFNGGGAGSTSDGIFASGGGGATDIRLDNGVNSRIMVAGGGGGSSGYGSTSSAGGAAGGLTAYAGNHTDSTANGKGGTQLKVGASGTRNGSPSEGGGFGEGTSSNSKRSSLLHSGGGGSGYYGGGVGAGAGGSGGGGSSFISGHNGCIAITSNQSLTPRKDSNNQKCTAESDDITCSYHFSNLIFTNTKIVDGKGYEWTTEVGTEVVGMPTHDGTSTMTGNEGNGYAKITLTRKIENDSEFDFDYIGDEQTFVAPYSGLYRLETWGAQGGKIKHEDIIFDGGYGGYSTGTINLNKNTILHIYNGGQGDVTLGNKAPTATAFNGGGSGYNNNGVRYISGGGGATHIALSSGLLYELENNKNNILIVSGGGGGVWYYPDSLKYYYTKQVGHAGGYVGNTGIGHHAQGGNYEAVGGTQTSGYAFGKGQNATSSEKSGGGGGYYGGMSTTFSGGGGSGYIGNDLLMNKVMYCYNCQESQDINTKTVSTLSHSLKPKQNTAKEGNGYSRITLLKRTINQTKLTLDFSFEEYVNGNEYTFGYTGEPQTFTVPKTAYYKIELWGARGGYANGSLGGYTSGKIKLNKNEKLYVYVGERNLNVNTITFNGGHASADGQPGGGATDIRLVSGEWNNDESLNSRIMVAAGGGAYAGVSPNLGYGGGLHGGVSYAANNYNTPDMSTPATQTSAGTSTHSCSLTYPSGFGVGGSCAGGGGGYYGGAGTAGNSGGGSGGSSFISGHNGCVAISSSIDRTPRNDSNGNQCIDGTNDITCSKHYSNYIFTDTVMIDGAGYSWTTVRSSEYSGMPTYDGSSTKTGNDSFGYAKITLVEEIPEYHFDYTGDVQEFVAPYNGVYKVELWGASGGAGSADEVNYIYPGGKGAYTSGNIELSKNQKLYLYVGKEGDQHAWDSEELSPSSWNGGGAGGFDASTTNTSDGAGSGGGATDIRLTSGQWNNFDGLKSRIMVAAGGGGGSWPSNNLKSGQNASGLYVKGLEIKSHNSVVNITDGTQFSGYKFGVGKDGEPDAPNAAIGGDGGGYWTGVYDATMRNGIGGTSYISGHQGCVSISESSIEDNISFVNDSNGVSCGSDTSLGYNASGYNADSLCSNHYSDMEFYDTSMIDGAGHPWTASGISSQVVEIPSHDGRTTMVGNTGNGYAKITLLQKSTDVVRDNLLLYFDGKKPGNIEGVWEDQSGNNLDGTIIDASFNRNALQLGTDSSGVSMGSKLIDLYKGSFTLEMYVTQYGTDYRDIIMGNYSDYNSMSIERGPSYSSTRKGRFYFNECQIDYRTGSDYIEFNAKHQLFYIFDKDNNKFTFGYDGKVIDTVENNLISDDYNFNNAYFFRDKRQGATTFDGEAYSVRIYDKVMSLNEMKSNYIYDKIYYK